jgi:GT2 family glycosyltransferase
MLISVVIPVFYGRDVIEACLDSLLSQKGSFEIEIIVIDDCSPDKAGDLIESGYPMVKLLRIDRNLGYAASVNRGIEMVSGECVLFLNQDTVLETGAVERLVDELQSDTSLSAVAPQLLNPDGTIQPSCRMLPRYTDVIYHHLLLPYIFPKSKTFSRWKMGWFSHEERAVIEQPSFSAILIKRDVVDSVGLLDERFRLFFNDVDYCKRMLDRGGRILFSPYAKVTHLRGHATGMIPVRKIVDSCTGFVSYFLKYKRGAIYVIPNAMIAVLLTLSAILRIVWSVVGSIFTSRESSSLLD